MPFAETPTGDLYYEICDLTPPWLENPQTVVFHHGVAGHPGMWTPWLGALYGRYRLVRFDMRGHARSVIPQAGYDWSFEGLVEDLMCVADAAGAHRFHFVGESIGGTAGIACALARPERLLSLTLSNTSPVGGLLGNVNVWREMVRTTSQREWAAQMMQWRFHPGRLDQATYDWYLRLHETCSMDVCFELADLLLAADYTKELDRITLPTLLLSPDDSPFIPARIMEDMHGKISGSELQVFAHSRHGLPFSHGADCAAVFAGFLGRRT
ncbi:MAG: alpha/beta fold hydrolase [Burkholderiales bacterium]|jgi:pimeloyl-ACP methyl ester carboxylesterase